MGAEHEFEPHLVEVEVAEGQVLEAGVFVVADVVLDAGALAVAALEQGDVRLVLVGQQDLEAVAVVVGDRQLGTRVGALAPDDPTRPRASRAGRAGG